MFLTRFQAAALIASVTVVTGYTYQSSPVNRPWPPGVQKVSNESPVLHPDEAVKEGPIGLMPPVGSVLSDDQIAAFSHTSAASGTIPARRSTPQKLRKCESRPRHAPDRGRMTS